VKLLALVFFHERPRLNARHFAPEASVLLMATIVALARALEPRKRIALVLALVAGAALLADDVYVARARGERRASLVAYTAALERFAPEPGRALVARNGYRLSWTRPGVFIAYPPATEKTLVWFDSKLPLSGVVLDVAEPLVAPVLANTGHPPARLGPFRLAGTDRSLGVTLLHYTR